MAVKARMAAPAGNPAELVAVEAANLGRYNDLLASFASGDSASGAVTLTASPDYRGKTCSDIIL